MDKIIAIENPENVCFCCLAKEDFISTFVFKSLGYGSRFDGRETKLQLCKTCLDKTEPRWWRLDIVKSKTQFAEDSDLECYKYEDEILAFIKTFPLQGRELFENRFMIDQWNGFKMKPQDWIDYELDILPHDKCQEYMIFSPDEKRAYKKRFPVCKEVFCVIYRDGSYGCRCDHGAFGKFNFSTNEVECHSQISKDCYFCNYFRDAGTNKFAEIKKKKE